MKIRSLATSALAAALLASCADYATSVVCPSVPAPALAIAVMDTAAGRSRSSEASGWFRVDGRQQALRFASTPLGDVLLAEGPSGVYAVEVRLDGHAPWSTSVNVLSDACGPATVRITATPERMDAGS